MKACIAVADYHVPGQTFVNRHIEHMFDGNTCVVASRVNDAGSLGPRLFSRQAAYRRRDVLAGMWAMPRNLIVHGTERVPFGSSRRALLAFLDAQAPDFILAEFGTQGIVMAPIAEEAGIPCYCYFRGSDASSQLRRPTIARAYRKMMPRLRGVFAVSQFLLDLLDREADVRHDNARVIPSGVNTDLFRPGAPHPMRAVFVGRMVDKKAPLWTIRAFAEAASRHPEAHLTMIGDGPLLEPARALVRELGLDGRVELPGAMAHDAVRAHMAEAEFYLQHSITDEDGNTEGLPTSIQEAMASGLIVISSRHAGIPEAVEHGRTGFLVDEGDAAGFTSAVARAYDLPADARAVMAGQAREVAEQRLDNRKLLRKLEDAIRSDLR